MSIPLSILLYAMSLVESQHNPNAYNPACGGTGILQITDIMLKDCNEIVGYERWSPEDRYDIEKSYEMAVTYFGRRCRGMDAEAKARCWNGGRKRYLNNPSATDEYWEKVLDEIKRIRGDEQ